MLSVAATFLTLYSISISTLFLVFLPLRLRQLWGSSIKILAGHPGRIKALASLAFLAIQLYVVILEAKAHHADHIPTFIVLSTIVPLIAALGLCLLSFFEYRRSVRPSSLLTVYLLASMVGGATLMTLPASQRTIAQTQNVILTQLVIQLFFVAVENRSKISILRSPYDYISTEEASGILGKTFFWWLNPILKAGNQSILVNRDLPHIDAELSSESLRRTILKAWNNRGKPDSSTTLPFVLLGCLIGPFLSAIIPRLFLVIFRYSQAMLIKITIRYVNQNERTRGQHAIDVLWLVMVAVIVYVGMAISTAIYQHHLNRTQVMIRGALVELIYHRSLNIEGGTHENGNAVTLMSTDVSNLESVGEMVHETWAQIFEVMIGTGLLANQIGWLFPVPLFFIFLYSHMSRFIAKHLKSKKKNWNNGTQKRIAVTASMLGSAKSMKMLGMVDSTISNIQDLRVNEIEMFKILKWMMFAYNASANALGIFTPVITLTMFAILSIYKGYWKLETDIVFTTTAILAMVTHPANMVMTIIPRAVASMGNFERVQRYLIEFSRQDTRLPVPIQGVIQNADFIPTDHSLSASSAVAFTSVTIQNSHTTQPILQEITFTMKKGSIVMCSGPVGVGKTTLAKAIIGEISCSTGSIVVFTKRIGFCSQVPWLPSGTIKQAICGYTRESDQDIEWYNSVLTVCSLSADLEALPARDETQIGSRGINLSGGQRQRIALARAIYARCDFLVLDDPFSALDGKTESHIVDSLLGPQGLFKKMGTTVFLITHAAQYFPLSDHVIILGDKTILSQGKWENLKSNLDRVSKITLRNSDGVELLAPNNERLKLQNQILTVNDAASDLRRKTGDTKLYNYYFKSVGVTDILILIFCASAYSFCLTFSQYWLKLWAEAEFSRSAYYIGGYLLLAFLAWSTTCAGMWSTVLKIAPISGFVLHKRLLEAIAGAPLSYYSTTEIGVMLNRFSQDIQLVDTQLPIAFSNICVQTSKLLVQAILLFIVQSIMTITLPFYLVIVYFIQKIYLRTSRQLRFIELESRSATYSSFLETIEGLSTIRAFSWQSQYTSQNTSLLDLSQRPFYLLFCLQRWLNLVLDLLIACIAVGIIGLAVFLKGSTTGSSIGVALNLVLIANTTLLKLVENWTTLEISLGAIARLKGTVEDTPREDQPNENLEPPKNWPSEGALELDDITVSYNSNAPPALKGITLKISPGQKIIICGRTGSGKSTLLLTLLHLLELQNGAIKLDFIDLSHVPRSFLRQRCFITIPQDPFNFVYASLRFNLDPSGSIPDPDIKSALEKTRIWEHFSALRKNWPEQEENLVEYEQGHETGAILDRSMSSIPPLSPGQLQLVSLSRALLRKQSHDSKPILLLDEATSSLDPHTESLIQDIIQVEFTEKGYTVIMVAHRVSAAIKGMRNGMDKVVWMSSGRIERISDVEELNQMGLEGSGREW